MFFATFNYKPYWLICYWLFVLLMHECHPNNNSFSAAVFHLDLQFHLYPLYHFNKHLKGEQKTNGLNAALQIWTMLTFRDKLMTWNEEEAADVHLEKPQTASSLENESVFETRWGQKSPETQLSRSPSSSLSQVPGDEAGHEGQLTTVRTEESEKLNS